MLQEMKEKQKIGPRMINELGKPSRQLSNHEIVQLIQSNQQIIQNLTKEKQEMNNTMMSIQSQLIEMSIKADTLEKENKILKEENEKLKKSDIGVESANITIEMEPEAISVKSDPLKMVDVSEV